MPILSKATTYIKRCSHSLEAVIDIPDLLIPLKTLLEVRLQRSRVAHSIMSATGRIRLLFVDCAAASSHVWMCVCWMGGIDLSEVSSSSSSPGWA